MPSVRKMFQTCRNSFGELIGNVFIGTWSRDGQIVTVQGTRTE